MKLWKLMNIVWILLFIVGIIFLAVRRVDGAGVVQTPVTRAIAIGVLVILFLLIAGVQALWGRWLKKNRNGSV